MSSNIVGIILEYVLKDVTSTFSNSCNKVPAVYIVKLSVVCEPGGLTINYMVSFF